MGRLEMRQFRRRERPDTAIVRDGETGRWSKEQKGRLASVPVISTAGPRPPVRAAFVDPESAARRRYEAAGMALPRGMARASIPASLEQLSGREVEITDDRFFGLLLQGQDPASAFGKTRNGR